MREYTMICLILSLVVSAFAQSSLLNLDDQGVILEGYDPVAYFTQHAAVEGSSQFQSSFEGSIYYFQSAENKNQFEGNPEKFKVLFGGFCAYAVSQGHVSPIDPKYCKVQKDREGVERLICQHNQKASDLWNKNPDGLLMDAEKYWPAVVRNGGKQIAIKGVEHFLINLDEQGLANQGYDVVGYHTAGKALMGDSKFSEWFHGGKYLFASKANQELFRGDPKKYLPQYGGFCAYAMSLGKIRPVNPQIFSIEGGRLMLQHTQEAYDLFYQDAKTNIDKADHFWPTLESKKAGHKVKFDKPAQ